MLANMISPLVISACLSGSAQQSSLFTLKDKVADIINKIHDDSGSLDFTVSTKRYICRAIFSMGLPQKSTGVFVFTGPSPKK